MKIQMKGEGKRRTRLANTALLALSLLVSFLILEAGLRWHYYDRYGPYRLAVSYALDHLINGPRPFGLSGLELNRTAWESSYTERGLQVPERGEPREGFWGFGIKPKDTACGLIGDLVCERPQVIPGLIEIDRGGFQHAGRLENPSPHILIIGGSVAFGAYASGIDKTYFHRLAGLLKSRFPDIGISVFGVGSALSSNDLAAFVLRGLDIRPDLVIFLNGLNDLVNPGGDDFSAYARQYLGNMEVAQHIAAEHNIPVVFALQPFLGEKKVKTALEERILDLSVRKYEETVNPHYDRIRKGLKALADRSPSSFFIDCSGIFNNEKVTTFADQWHFSDPGHEILAAKLARDLLPVLEQIAGKPRGRKTEAIRSIDLYTLL